MGRRDARQLIDEKGCVHAWRDLGGDFGEMEGHRLGVAPRHDEGCAFAALGQIAPKM